MLVAKHKNGPLWTRVFAELTGSKQSHVPNDGSELINDWANTDFYPDLVISGDFQNPDTTRVSISFNYDASYDEISQPTITVV